MLWDDQETHCSHVLLVAWLKTLTDVCLLSTSGRRRAWAAQRKCAPCGNVSLFFGQTCGQAMLYWSTTKKSTIYLYLWAEQNSDTGDSFHKFCFLNQKIIIIIIKNRSTNMNLRRALQSDDRRRLTNRDQGRRVYLLTGPSDHHQVRIGW